MLVLDTDILSIVQWKTGVEYARLVSRLPADAPESVVVTIVSFEEQARGWLARVARARTPNQQLEAYGKLFGFWRDFCARQVLAYDDAAIARFEELRRTRLRVGTMDLRIAAIALTQRAKLISRNLADFRRVPGLQVEDWTLPE